MAEKAKSITYCNCKQIISKGSYDKKKMLDRLDIFLLNERVTDEEYNELVAEINGSDKE